MKRPIVQIVTISALLLGASSISAGQAPIVLSVDLNGDGRPDTITVTCGCPGYTVKVNETVYEEGTCCIGASTAIVDVNTSDKWKEFTIFDPGPSDDPKTSLFEYSGTKKPVLRKIGTIQGHLQTDGHGAIYGRTRGRILQTWSHSQVYALDSTRTITQIPQELYDMGTHCTVKRQIPIYASRADQTIVAVLEPGENVTIVASDDIQWCFVASDRACGWFQIKKGTQSQLVNPSADAYEVFDGLSAAD